MIGEAGRGFGVMVRIRLRANRISLAVMTVLMAVFSTVTLQSYGSVFPDRAARTAFLTPLANNGALRVLYGYPFDIGEPTGFVSWRMMTSVGVAMAMWAAIITTGALRGEEDSGRGELVLSGLQPRRRWLAAALTATLVQTVVIGVVSVLALAAVGLPQQLLGFADCWKLGLQMMLPALVFAAIAALTSQLAPTVRSARLFAAGILVAALAIRAPADIGSGRPWLRWLTPLGWFEQLRPPAAPDPVLLIVIAVATAVPIVLALRLLRARDIGLGVLGARDSRSPRYLLLGSPWQAALRDEAPQLAFWFGGTVLYTALLGALVKTMLEVMHRIPNAARFFGEQVAVNGFVAAMYSIVQLVAALLAVTLVVAARGEESSGRLELLLAMPRSRIGWLAGRALLAAGVASALTVVAAVALWAGATATGERIGFSALLEAAGNSLPLIALTVGCATAALAFAPRAVVFVHALVVAAFLWNELGTALKAPNWTLQLSPFHALARVPMEHFAFRPASTLVAIGAVAFGAGLYRFRRRDLIAA